MKWFMHISRSGDDPDIHDGIEIFGPESYYIFFRILELMSDEFDIENPGKSTFSAGFLKKKLQVSYRKVVKNLEFFTKKRRIFCKFYKEDGLDKVDLNCPKLKDLADEYTKKLLTKKSGFYPDSNRELESDLDLELESYLNKDQCVDKISDLLTLKITKKQKEILVKENCNIFHNRGWCINYKICEGIAKSVNKNVVDMKGVKNQYGYFQKSLQNYINKNADKINDKIKKSRNNV